ncbi:hypothetical protein [Burkholderia sp. Bp8984]|uniref:hypothetical protein n=1 Tax=Burkholderia sp. Bp8984 TaxID=2184549 RepID=UPI000F59D7C6|nr:hypothetical protein [Burkholderia sp. Bp8984]
MGKQAATRHRPCLGLRTARRAKKDARCTQRARIPVKEVSHELRVQIKEIACNKQRIDFNIDMTGCTHAGTPSVEQRMPPPCRRRDGSAREIARRKKTSRRLAGRSS